MESKATGHAACGVGPILSMAPILQSLALHVTNILLSPTLSWSIVVRQSWLVTSLLIASNTSWWVLVQPGHSNSLDFVVQGVSKCVWSARCGKNWSRYRTNPRNECMLLVDWGTGQSKICLALDVLASTPDAVLLLFATRLWCHLDMHDKFCWSILARHGTFAVGELQVHFFPLVASWSIHVSPEVYQLQCIWCCHGVSLSGRTNSSCQSFQRFYLSRNLVIFCWCMVGGDCLVQY